MSFESLCERLNALQQSNAQLKELINRLATTEFRPGSVALDDVDGGVVAELTAEIHQMIREQDEDFELLQAEICCLPSGKLGSQLHDQKDRLEEDVKRSFDELNKCQVAFRRAQLLARRRIEAAQKEERQALVKSFTEPGRLTSGPDQFYKPSSVELPREEREINASSDVTAALRRTHEMMVHELSRSQFAHDTLHESTAALAQLSETYSSLDTLISRSKNLLGTLLRSQKSDTWYLETAFYLLAVTIGWLVFRRLLYGPTWWLFWFPMKMFLKGWVGVLTSMGFFRGSGVDVGVHSTEGSVAIESRVPEAISRSDKTIQHIDIRDGNGVTATTSPNLVATMSEQVARILDASSKRIFAQPAPTQTEFESEFEFEPEPDPDAEPNPKKRMWEDDADELLRQTKIKDEL